MSNIRKIERIKRPFYTLDDIRQLLGLSPQSVALFCTRAVKRGDLIRVMRGLYVLPNFENYYRQGDFFKLANLIQTPSYVSFLTALAFYEISTQIPAATYESVNTTRSVEYNASGVRFIYFQTKVNYYFGFKERDGFFIAEPEKALIDSAHLASFGKYSIDLSALNFQAFDFKKINSWLKNYPLRTKNLLKKWRERYGTT